MELPEESRFYFRGGGTAKNLNELYERLQRIPYDEFYHHVDGSKNDFANWVRFVLRDSKLADELEKVTSIVETVEVLNDYLHPQPAKMHLSRLDDIQSRIEKEALRLQLPDEGGEMAAPPVKAQDSWDLSDQPDLDEPAPPISSLPDVPTEDDSLQWPAPAEMAAAPRPDDTVTSPRRNVSTATTQEADPYAAPHIRKEEPEREELKMFHHDVGRVIVKDFLVGMLFGILLGVILGRIFIIV